ncbi:hypothetical protein ACVWXM_009620 [Bradyrhizobium sp. GM7.3]
MPIRGPSRTPIDTPGTDPRSAKPYLLAHLLIILLLEPLARDFEDSPRWMPAA